MAKKEAQARIKINRLLAEAGWRLEDNEKGKCNVQLESTANFHELGDDFEHAKHGFIDFLLLGNDDYPLAVLEAKRENIHPLSAKEQARDYANSVHARYIILSNGNIHYLWDTKEGNPEQIMRFPAQTSLEHFQAYNPNPQALTTEIVETDYIAQSQMPDFHLSPEWQADGEERDRFKQKNKLVIMRQYQLEAIKAIQAAAKNDKKRYLLEMATGTGKTLTCAAIIKLFLRTGNAKRVLFLVDRIELENQAATAFHDYLGKDYLSTIYKRDRDGWNKAQIIITTVQSLLVNNRYRDIFSPTDFELVISDEAHRSINGDARAVFEYFVGYRVGLTATPKDYLKGFDKSLPNTQKEFEHRQLLSTYTTFGCESGEPTYQFSLTDGVPEYLVSPVVVDARTEITTQLLSDQGYSIHKVTEEGVEVEGTFSDKDYERKVFNDDTNRILCEEFLSQADTDPISGEIGKSLVFAVSQNHAAKIVNIFNQLAHQRWPDKYQSDFAIQVTSNVPNAQIFTTQFTNNNLKGHTQWLPNYESSKARICVTVAMMTTGYDCPDLLNVAFMRPVYSPSDFIQMKGRGTRKYTHKYTDYDSDEQIHLAEKTQFKLIDFFAVCEYFNEKYDYTVKLALPKKITYEPKGEEINNQGETGVADGPEDTPPTGPVNLYEQDKIETRQQTIYGKDGMVVDREMFRGFILEQSNNLELQKLDEDNKFAAMDYLKRQVFDKPKYHMTLEKISKLFKLGRRLDVEEALDLIMGRLNKPKTKQELLTEKFDEIVAINDLAEKFSEDPVLYQNAKAFFDAYISSNEVKQAVDSGHYQLLTNTPELSYDEFSKVKQAQLYEPIVNYIHDYINVEKLRG
jgi:type I restriction enzyme, R subunit